MQWCVTKSTALLGEEAFIYLHVLQVVLPDDSEGEASSQNKLAIVLESWVEWRAGQWFFTPDCHEAVIVVGVATLGSLLC